VEMINISDNQVEENEKLIETMVQTMH